MREYVCIEGKRRLIDGRFQDVISLVVQGVGGGLAATAVPNGRDPRVVRIIFLARSILL